MSLKCLLKSLSPTPHNLNRNSVALRKFFSQESSKKSDNKHSETEFSLPNAEENSSSDSERKVDLESELPLSSKRDNDNGPPVLPGTCCMSGCANCVWLDYAAETVKYYEDLGEEMDFNSLIVEVGKNIDDPMIKAFITMELKSKYVFGKR